MRRRDFLLEGSRAALNFSLFPLAARAQGRQKAPALKEIAPWKTLLAELEGTIPELMAEAAVPGLSLALIKDGKLLWRRGFGVRDAASRAPVDNDTVFEAASMSKPVFAYATMKLCELGLIGLDTPLTRYAAERFLEGDARLDLITARHVLSHTSGFQNWRSSTEPLRIHFPPGTKYLYSGEGYSYLQSVVTQVTGQPIEPFMQAHLLLPFGMSSSGYVWRDTFERRAARPHDAKGRPFDNKKRTAQDAARYAAAGDLHTTPTDYARFLSEVINSRKADAFRLNRNSLQEMLRPQVKVDDSKSWALGWQIVHAGTHDFIAHGGHNDGFYSYAAASVERKSGYVVMTNSDNGVEVLKKLVVGEAVMNRFLTA
jgi:CubicO group peptidase (beta-lactamase class C family)